MAGQVRVFVSHHHSPEEGPSLLDWSLAWRRREQMFGWMSLG